MLVLDRVICNGCFGFVGQLFNQNAQAAGLIEDKNSAPHFVVCVDCCESIDSIKTPRVLEQV